MQPGFRAVFFVCLGLGSSADQATGLASEVNATTAPSMKYYKDLVKSLPSLQGKCVAITGTTSGLGYWAAVATVQKEPSCLIMLNRNSSRSAEAEEDIKKQAPGVSVFTVLCDLQNISQVREAASRVNDITARFGGLDVLALNAGVMDQPDDRTLDGFDVTMQTNHLSHFLLTKLLLPSLRAASGSRGEVRIVGHSSLCRGTNPSVCGGDQENDTHYLRSAPSSLGGNSFPASRERYHQSKLANIVFAMALHSKFASAPSYSNFKALSAAPGFSDTSLHVPVPKWVEHFVALSAPDGSCSLLTAMFAPSAQSGDFYEPKELFTGPPVKVIDRGVPLPVHFASIRHAAGIRDTELCSTSTMAAVWNASETGLGEAFIIGADTYII